MIGLAWPNLSVEFWYLVGFHVFILFMLGLDLGIFQRDGNNLLNLLLGHRPDGDGHDAVFGQEVRG